MMALIYVVVSLFASLLSVGAAADAAEEVHHYVRRDQEETGTDLECTPLLMVSHFKGDEPEEEWNCQLLSTTPLAEGMFGRILKLDDLENLPEDVAKDLDSGKSLLTIPGATTTSKGIKIPKGTKATLTKGTKGKSKVTKGLAPTQDNFLSFPSGGKSEDNFFVHGQRRLQNVGGNRTLLVVRVSTVGNLTSEPNPSANATDLSDYVFGTYGDSVNLASQSDACSFGKLTFTPLVSGLNSAPGVYEVEVNTTSNDHIELRDAITIKLNQKLPYFPNALDANLDENSPFQHVLYCMPPGTNMDSPSYAFVNSWLSVYKYEKGFSWCRSPTAAQHHIGHNVGLAHSGEDGTEVGDQTGIMGYVYSGSDGPQMCYNAAKTFQLGWFSDKTLTFVPDSTVVSSWSGPLFGFVDYENSGPNDVVLIKLETLTDLDYYINFNLASGFNIGTQEYANRVLITSQGKNGVAYSRSTLFVHLSTGESYVIETYSWSYQVTVHDINTTSLGFANVTITVTPSMVPNVEPSFMPSHEPSLSMVPSTSFAPSTHPGIGVYFVNCGGADYEDSLGNTWIADEVNGERLYHDNGMKYWTTNNITGTDDQALFQTERYQAMNWTFPIDDPGDYKVSLLFAEIYSGAFNVSRRVFNVRIEGNLVLQNFDIFDEVGAETALTKTFPVTVTGSNLTIEFIKVIENPKVSAIEIRQIPSQESPVSVAPSQMPSGEPSADPSEMPSGSLEPSAKPSSEPSLSLVPSSFPSVLPSLSARPSDVLSMDPTLSRSPSDVPSNEPSLSPSKKASDAPSASSLPSGLPSGKPSISLEPSEVPSSEPSISVAPSEQESSQPSQSSSPSKAPSNVPSSTPSEKATDAPSDSSLPSGLPSGEPSVSLEPSEVPSSEPSISVAPSERGSNQASQSSSPSYVPSNVPSSTPSDKASNEPSMSLAPSGYPSSEPSVSLRPSGLPSGVPSLLPSEGASSPPSLSSAPSGSPSGKPSLSLSPSNEPSNVPSVVPSEGSSSSPSLSAAPSVKPSGNPSLSLKPSYFPSSEPSNDPSSLPSSPPTETASISPSLSSAPSGSPSGKPSLSLNPSSEPSSLPSLGPSGLPSSLPSGMPSSKWEQITFDDFESGWGNWQDGGSDAKRQRGKAKQGPLIINGTVSVRLRDNSGSESSIFLKDPVDVSGFSKLRVNFWYRARSMDNVNEDFFLEYSTDNGANYAVVKQYILGDDFNNSDTIQDDGNYDIDPDKNFLYNETVNFDEELEETNYTNSSLAKIRFRCDASGNSDFIYIDDVSFEGYAE